MSGLEFGETPGDLGPGNQFYKNATPSGDPYIDGLLFFRQWKVAEITFSFPTSGAFYEYTNEPSGFVAANSANIAAFRDALREISRVTPLTFAELTETSSQHAILRLGATTVDGNFPAAYYPDDSAQAGDVWLKANSGDPDWETPVAGNRGWTVMRHELGHAFGLKHPFEDIAPEFPMMPADRNFKEFTVMAYNGFMAGNGVNFADFQPTTYMIYDIAALQHLYGANFNFRSGDTTYAFDPNTGEMTINGLPQGAPFINRIFMTSWDGGGAETVDLSAYSNDLVVDLEPGSWSVLPTQLAGHPGIPT
ncbi:MAG: M10 family metallopeptidase [Parvularculaceae bacterium]